VLAVSALALQWAGAGIRRGDRKRLAIGFAGAMILGGVFLVIQAIAVITFEFEPTDHAYAALSHVLIGYQAFHLIIAMVMGAMVLARIWRGDFSAERHVAVRIATTFWYYSAALWIIGFILVYLAPMSF
jgi:cytochrome c oxidase subunit 3